MRAQPVGALLTGVTMREPKPTQTQKNTNPSKFPTTREKGSRGREPLSPCSFPHFSREMGPPLGRRTPVALSGRFVKRPYDGVGGDHNPDEQKISLG